MDLHIIQLCKIQEVCIVIQRILLQQVTDDQFMTTRNTDIINKYQRFALQEIAVKMVFIVDDKRLPAFHVQFSVIDTVRFKTMDLCTFHRVTVMHTQITVQHFIKGCRHVIGSRRDHCIGAGQHHQLFAFQQRRSIR